MQRNWIIVAVALAAWPGGLTAQGTPRPPRPSREPRVRAFMLSDHRGRIGVVVKTDASPETDKIGAKIEGVTPGGPADKAGLKVGDIISKFNGTSLAAVKSEDEDESGPGRKLVEVARGLEPAPEGRRRDHVDRRTEARQPVARDADPAVVRDGRNGIDRDPAQAEAHEPDLEGSRARRPLLPHAPGARRARGSERAAAPPAQAAGAPAARLRNARRWNDTEAADDAAPVVH